MEGLPLLPGYAFHDPTIRDFKLKHKFAFTNGHRVIRDSNYGVGRRPINAASSAYATSETDTLEYDPSLTYGRVREYGYSQVVPDYALFAQKCLNFKAFFRQCVFNSPVEHYRIRHVNIIYFLEDNTMSVMEPTVENAGFKQGRLVRRGKIDKNQDGSVYHWKDLNVGIDIAIYGVVYHTVDCDLFTREFLRSQGIDVGDKEEAPVDPYTQRLVERENTEKTSDGTKLRSDDARRRFLEYDGMVLSFEATWNEDSYQIMFFLTDDTIAIREIHKPNDGKDPSAMLLKRTKVPKNWKDLPSTYPAIYLERSDPEVLEYYSPKDFKIGETIFIFGRRFLLQDCDAFTRKYYSGMLCMTQPPGIVPERKSARETSPQLPVAPPHIAFGTPEDTLAACLSFSPKPPKKDVVRELFNFPKKLRYLATFEAVHLEDQDRDFILEYALSDGRISISEIEKKNSGRRAGCFLSPTLVPKPGSGRDNPFYYTPEDFYIGAKINVFNHRFVINDIDLFVYRYVEANPDKFCRELRDNLRNHVIRQGMLRDEIDREAIKEFEAQEEKCESEVKPVSNSFDESVRSCQDELAQNSQQKDDNIAEIDEQNRCKEMLYPSEKKYDNPEVFSPTVVKDSERKQIAWADQIDEDAAGHPIISCRPELPECTKQPATLRSCLKPRNITKPAEERLEVHQLMYENARDPAKPKIPELRTRIERNPIKKTIQESCPFVSSDS